MYVALKQVCLDEIQYRDHEDAESLVVQIQYYDAMNTLNHSHVFGLTH